MKNYVAEAVKQVQQGKTMNGRPWFVRHPMTKRVLLLYVKHSFRDELTQAWLEKTTQEEADDEDAVRENPPLTGKGKRRGDRQDDKNGVVSPKKKATNAKAKDGDQQLKDLILGALKLKKEMLEASTACTDLLTLIHTSPEWEVFDSDKQFGPLRKAKQSLDEEKSKTDFWKDWTLQDKWAQYVKRNYSSTDVVKHLSSLESTPMCTAVQAVMKETNRLKRMKAAGDSDE